MPIPGEKKKPEPVVDLGEIARLAREYDRITQAYRRGKITNAQRQDAIKRLLTPKPQADPLAY